MKLGYKPVIWILFLAGVLSACRPVPEPFPQSVDQAALANFRKLTDTGLAAGAVWSPDGKSLAYTSLEYLPYPFSYTNQQPKRQVWISKVNGGDQRHLTDGMALFFSNDSSSLYYLRSSGKVDDSLWSIDPKSGAAIRLVDYQTFIGQVEQLADGRLVLSEWGTYAPLSIYDPANGKIETVMKEHPSNDPQDARLSPDGTLLAYPKGQDIYLSQSDGSNPRLLSQNGGFSAKVQWSSDSQHIAYTTGAHQTDSLMVADRNGENKITLISRQEETGYISSILWSPDSRWILVTADPYEQYSRPTHLILFDLAGHSHTILTSYLLGPPAWSPDGRSLALAIWSGPQVDDNAVDIWLADLTTKGSAAPTIVPTPTLIPQPAGLAPEDVIRRFWSDIESRDYRAALSLLSEKARTGMEWPSFRAYYACFQRVDIKTISLADEGDTWKAFSVALDIQSDPACDVMWHAPGEYTVVAREPSNGEWRIDCFNSAPNCTPQGP
jgi:Tol biopolymer transport system component